MNQVETNLGKDQCNTMNIKRKPEFQSQLLCSLNIFSDLKA